jgi:putative membrane protein
MALTYLIVKAAHLVGVVAWFAGLFYIFRLLVYHVENRDKPEVAAVLTVMARKLYFMITTPAMLLATAMGIALMAMNPEVLARNWFRWKLFFLIFLFAYHFYAGHVRRRFAAGDFFITSRQCRLINEIPTLILLVIVALAVIKPL